MYTIRSLRLNDFQLKSIPSARTLYEQLGYRQPTDVQGIDADVSTDEVRSMIPANIMADKLTSLHLGELVAAKAKEFHEQASETQSLNIRDIQRI